MWRAGVHARSIARTSKNSLAHTSQIPKLLRARRPALRFNLAFAVSPFNHRAVTFGQRSSGALRPGLIILLGVVAIALVLVTILLLPAPNIRGVVKPLIPPGTTIVSELNYGDLIGISGDTEASLTDVAEFYRERLRLGRGPIVGGGISSWSKNSLFGGLRSGVTMPYSTEGFVILVSDKKELLAVVASRAANETTTCVEVFCKRGPDGRALRTRANSLIPVDGVAGASALSALVDCAMFTSSATFSNITADYLTKSLKAQPQVITNRVVSPAGNGMVSVPKRTGADSATFLARITTLTNETLIIHCFRSPNSAQTHVLVGSTAR